MKYDTSSLSYIVKTTYCMGSSIRWKEYPSRPIVDGNIELVYFGVLQDIGMVSGVLIYNFLY
jgi:hypothetical protein